MSHPFRLSVTIVLLLMSIAHCACDARNPQPPSDADPVVAVVLGKEVRESEVLPSEETILDWQLDENEVQEHRVSALRWEIIGRLREQFVAAHDALPTGEELDEARQYFRTKVTHARSGQTQRETRERLKALEAEAATARANQQQRPALQEEIDELRGFLDQSIAAENTGAEWIAGDWKFRRALHRKYGGRACRGETGPEAIDAMRAWLREAADRGDFSFAKEADQAAFWSQFPANGEPIQSEIEDAARTFETLTAYTKAFDSVR